MISSQNTDPLAASPDAGHITVLLDGQPRCIGSGTRLHALVEQLGHAPEQVSTALNGEFVARAARADRVLAAGDAVLLFQPIVGG